MSTALAPLFALACVASCSDPSVDPRDAGGPQLNGDAAEASAPVPDGSASFTPPSGCALGACPSSDDGMVGPAVSFRRDLVLALQRNCNDAICHGSPESSAAGLYLGAPLPMPVNASAVIASLVGVASRTAPDLPLVAPGEPERSFLLLKVEGCQNATGLACTPQPGAKSSQPCGDTMPQLARPLCNAERDFLRRWVRQGAGDN